MLPSAAGTSSQFLRVAPQSGYILTSNHEHHSNQQHPQSQLQAQAQPLQYPLQNSPTLFSQPYQQSQFGSSSVTPATFKNDQNTQQSITRLGNYQIAPELPQPPAANELRLLPQAPLLPPQQQPPHALLPRMQTVQPILHPLQMHLNEYYVASSSGLQQGPQLLQYQDSHYHLQIPYYQQQQQSQVPVGGSSGNPQQQYLLLPSGNALVLQLSPTTQTSGATYGLYQPPAGSGGYQNLQSVPQTLLGQFQYPMPGQVSAVPQLQPLYTQSPTLLKMNPYKTQAHSGYEQPDGNSRQQYSNGSALQYNGLPDSAVPKGTGKKNECPVCQKVFKRPSSLQIHFYIHTGVKLYKCEWEGCGRLFNVKLNMTRHFKLHLKNEKG